MTYILPKTLVSFSLDDYWVKDDEDGANAISKWITYTGASYGNLQGLGFNCGRSLYIEVVNEDLLQDPLNIAMSNMTQISSLTITFNSLSQTMFNVMDSNNIQLKKSKLKIQDDNLIDEVFHYLQHSKSANTIDSLEIRLAARGSYASDANAAFANLRSNTLKFLTHLKVEDAHFQKPRLMVTFVDILQNLLTLESLVFQTLVTSYLDGEQDQMFLSRLNVVNPDRLKSFSLQVQPKFFPCKKDNMEKVNLLFQFTLASCPLLREFRLNGEIKACGAFNLDFREHGKLKHIAINLKGCRYYISHHLIDKQ